METNTDYLFVKLEAMSPGDFTTKGTGLQIRYGIHDTPFGKCLLAIGSRGICNLYFLDSIDEQTAVGTLRLEWINAEIIADRSTTQITIDRIFDPAKIDLKPLIVCVKGTNFQIQVWQALLGIPLGGMISYQGLAQKIDRPTAARAVGNAVGSNPVSYLIPCHRVIRASGDLGGYRWGLERKIAMLDWEASNLVKTGEV